MLDEGGNIDFTSFTFLEIGMCTRHQYCGKIDLATCLHWLRGGKKDSREPKPPSRLSSNSSKIQPHSELDLLIFRIWKH